MKARRWGTLGGIQIMNPIVNLGSTLLCTTYGDQLIYIILMFSHDFQ
jgi:hypothetical protein